MLLREPDITIIGQAGTVEEARPLLAAADIALIDLDLPDEEGVALIRELLAVNPKAIALVLTGSRSSLAMARAVEAGAVGVMHKSRPVSEVMEAIHRLKAGEPLLSMRETIEMLRFITRQRDQNAAVEAMIGRLTPREREVLQALAAGLSDDEIAEQLTSEHETVRTPHGQLAAQARGRLPPQSPRLRAEARSGDDRLRMLSNSTLSGNRPVSGDAAAGRSPATMYY